MPCILNFSPEGKPARASGPESLRIHGADYRNAAAKFWGSLAEEIMADFTSCSGLELATLCGTPIGRELLHPERALGQEQAGDSDKTIAERIREAIREFEVYGGPSPVEVRVLGRAGVLHQGRLPMDCIDSDILAYLVAWLYEWAAVPEQRWTEERVRGGFTARDVAAARSFAVVFEVENVHLSEGLYRRTVALRFEDRSAPAAT